MRSIFKILKKLKFWGKSKKDGNSYQCGDLTFKKNIQNL